MSRSVFAVLLALVCGGAFAGDAVRDAAAAFERGDLAAAERILQSSLKADSGNAGALGLLAVVFDRQKKYEEAEGAYRRAIRLRPNSASLLNNYANHQLARGDLAGARDTYGKVVALDPAHANANLQLASIALERKNGADALACLKRLPAAERSSPQAAILEMRALYLTGREREGAAILARLSSASGANPRLSFTLGLALVSALRYAEAETCFSKALERSPADFDILYNLGLAAFHAGNEERAREALQAALAQRPRDVDTLYNLAAVNIHLNQREAAMALLAQAARLEPSRPNVQSTLAQTASALGYYGDAAGAYESYLKLVPGDESARREHGFMLAAGGRREEGLSELREFLRRHPGDATAHYEIGIAQALSDPAEAAAHLDRAVALQPDFVPARFGRGVLSYLQGKAADALPDFEFAAQRYPENAAILDRLGQAYATLDRYPEAVTALRRAATIAPRDARILMHLSRALSATGQKAEARAALERFRAIGSDQVNRLPQPGLVDFLGLPSEQLYARYRAEVEKRLAAEPRDAGLNVRYLKVLLGEGKSGEAAAIASRLLELEPPALVAAEAARALLDAGRYAEARPLLEYAVRAAATAEVQLDLAIARFHTAGADEGLAQLDRIQEAERSGDYHLARAQMLDAAGKSDEAGAELRRALSAAPTRPDLYQQAAAFLVKHDRRDEAVWLLDEASRALPGNPQVLLLRASIVTAARPEDGKRALREIQNRWPEWAPPYAALGIVLEAQKQSEEAKAQLETAVALGASGPELYFYLARATLAATPDRLDDAAKAIRQAIALAPSDPWVQALAGRIAFDSQNYQAAIDYLREAVRLRPNFLQARYRLVQAFSALGLKEDAAREREEFRRLREQNPDADKDAEDLWNSRRP